MDIMISINPPYTTQICNGYKTAEFRKSILNSIEEDINLFCYGNDLIEPYNTNLPLFYIYETKNKGGSGKVIGKAYVELVHKPQYIKRNELIPEADIVKERFKYVKEIYFIWCGIKGIKPNRNEGWFKNKKYLSYLNEIGANSDNLDFNYVLYFVGLEVFEKPKELSQFLNRKNETMLKPPQNMCYCSVKKTKNN